MQNVGPAVKPDNTSVKMSAGGVIKVGNILGSIVDYSANYGAPAYTNPDVGIAFQGTVYSGKWNINTTLKN